MSRQVQIRRGSATAHTNFTGALGEVTMDTTNKTLRVHDGVTPGGTVLAKQSEIPEPYSMPNNYDFVVESQLPTAENNYTWYRKYKSGWVEQGGTVEIGNLNDGAATSQNVNLSVSMSDTNYNVTTCGTCPSSNFNRVYTNCGNKATNSISLGARNIGGTTQNIKIIWSVCGICVTE